VKSLEAHHWESDPFDEVMTLLDYIIQVFGLQDLYKQSHAGEFKDHIQIFV
jgi:hypothetical protein